MANRPTLVITFSLRVVSHFELRLCDIKGAFDHANYPTLVITLAWFLTSRQCDIKGALNHASHATLAISFNARERDLTVA